MLELTRLHPPESPARPADAARTADAVRPTLRVGLVQHRWEADQDQLLAELNEGIARAAALGAAVVFLPELTLSRYPADTLPEGVPAAQAEDLMTGPTFTFAAAAASANNVCVHASLYERADVGDGDDGGSNVDGGGAADAASGSGSDGLGLNTAILVSPSGQLLARTRKLHIPVTEGYYEDKYFRHGPATGDAYQVHTPGELNGARLGMPTCWDEWFPEVARLYSLGGAEVLAYPTAIGSEPGHPDFDTQPLWQQVIVGNGIANGLFMVVPNRWGDEGNVQFYGSSFISDPYGRILVQAPRDESAVLVADLDLAQRSDWLELFPFLSTRRPDTYGRLVEPVRRDAPYGDSTVEPATAGKAD
ncbi:nitrilase-related carbon-nitrogen hydrolase [Arthrobacter castelli]|uniref:nitrilase-related carbon-nitrogen hydrolase n=1 Tax=Arthrobacter castelli TaxID=271431 RepID=UPI00047EC67C|nr:nitrilase-related carbon-nitrogen hydrolase [Arthrobacter castelli]